MQMSEPVKGMVFVVVVAPVKALAVVVSHGGR